MSDSQKTKILIVDDLAEKLLVYQVILQELGQELVFAHSGTEALKQILQHDFAVILLDVNMPDMDGFETAALIRNRKRSSHTPIIFVTAFSDEVRMSEGYAHGAVDYILSPVVPEVLRAKVKVFVDLFRMTEQVKRQAEEQITFMEERSKRAAAEEANRRLAFLARAGAIVGQSLDYDGTTRDIARIAVPTLGDHAVVARPGATNGTWQLVEAVDELGGPAVRELSDWEGPSLIWRGAIEKTLAHGEPTTSFSQATGELESKFDPDLVFLPLRARGRVLGVLAASRQSSRRTFSPADITMAEALAARAAIALDNARLYKEVENADRQKNEFLSMLAHELRNPLAPIRNALTFLRMSGDNDPDVIWARELIDRQVTHLVRLVDDLLDVSRITRGKIRIELAGVDLAAVVSGAVETSRPLIEAGTHQLEVSLPEEPLWVNADQARLSQVLANLLNNAAKYTPEGGLISISAAREETEARICVRDNGMGIPAEMLARVFDLFTQVDRSLDRSQGGLGIGLTLVQRLVELHGGRVQVASEGPGRGSEFTVRLPLAHAPPQLPTDAPADATVSSLPAAKRLRILVVDDNVEAADSLARLLRLEGHQVSCAYDGISAIELAEKTRPQVAILDLGLPGIDGFEVARRLRNGLESTDIQLFALSGYGQEEDHRRSSQAGFDKHFNKPLDFPRLVQALAAAFPENRSELVGSRLN
jgi:signal transduction histidine kinase/DNA-binding response OmpR family regulator